MLVHYQAGSTPETGTNQPKRAKLTINMGRGCIDRVGGKSYAYFICGKQLKSLRAVASEWWFGRGYAYCFANRGCEFEAHTLHQTISLDLRGLYRSIV